MRCVVASALLAAVVLHHLVVGAEGAACSTSEEEALLDLYERCGGIHWPERCVYDCHPWNRTVWCCLWDHVACDAQSHVVELALTDLALHCASEPSISALRHLTTLSLERNGLQTVPTWIGQLSRLEELNLSVNQLKELPEVLGNLTELRALYVHSNNILELPDWLSELHHLRVLNAHTNQLKALPEALRHMKSLEQLILDRNHLLALEGWVGEITGLVHLGVSSNNLTTLPQEMGNMTALQELDISWNQLTILPESLGGMALRELYLYSNRLQSLPETIGSMKDLIKMNLELNRLTTLPDGIGGLTSLTWLCLRSNKLTTLPEALGSMSSLFTLDLKWNQVAKLPESIGTMKSLVSLDVSNNLLESLPEGIGELSTLEWLDVSSNLLREVPTSIGQLSRLTWLSLRNNKVIVLPESLGGLVQLSTLNLGWNQLTSLPSSIVNLKALKNMQLTNNQLIELPEELGKLELLTDIGLSSNRLESLPDSIGSLTHARSLDVSSNHITEIPATIGEMTTLEDLNLITNHLVSLPESIGRLQNLLRLFLGSNPLVALPESIGNLTRVITLSVVSTNLSVLPESFGGMIELQWALLQSNQLTGLPWSSGQLESLEQLNLNSNLLKELPESMGQLSRLQSLDLKSNLLEFLPESIGNLTQLGSLQLSSNRLVSLPETLGNLENLGSLLLNSNQLQSLPASMKRLSSLTSLDLSDNALSRVDATILQLPHLLELSLRGNVLDQIDMSSSTNGLRRLDISNNRLQQVNVGVLNGVTWLDASNNQLKRLDWMAYMSHLETADVSGNLITISEMTGQFPYLRYLQFFTAHNCFNASLELLELDKRAPMLTMLDLSSNLALRGPIPDALGNLVELRILRLQDTNVLAPVNSACESKDPGACVPSFLEPGPLVTRRIRTSEKHYSCYQPTPRSHFSALLVEIDWDAYFQNQLCRCHAGYVGRRGVCYACPENTECPGGDGQTVMMPMQGHWALVSGNVSSTLSNLNLNGVCPSSSSSSTFLESSWLSVCPLASRSMCSPSVPRSVDEESKVDLWKSCASGYTGRMCTECVKTHTKWGNRCYVCPASDVAWAIYGVGAACVTLIGILLWLWLRKDVDTDAIKTLLFFTQVLTLLPSLGISIPGSLAGVSEGASVSSLAIPGISCIWKGYDDLSSFWFKWSLFPTIIILVCGGNAIRAWLWKRSGTMTAGLIFLVTSLYLPMSSLVLRSLRCEWDSCLGESFFSSFPSSSCETDRAIAVRVTAWVLVSVFVLGVPLCLGWILWRTRSRGQLGDPDVQARIGQLYLCYTEERWWWEAIVTTRRLLVAASVSLVPMESGITPLALFVFFLVGAELQRALQPYRSARENRLELVTLLLLGLNVVSVLSLGVSEQTWARQFIAALVIVADALWIIVLIGVSVRGVTLRLWGKGEHKAPVELDEPLIWKHRQ